METKQCLKCRSHKSQSEFPKHSGKPDGLFPVCKQCKSEYDRARYAKKSDQYKRKAAEWKAANPERHKLLQERSRKARRDDINRRQRESRANHPERHAGYSRAYRERNPEAVRQSQRKWRASNPDRSREVVRQKQARRAKAMPSWADKDAISAVYSEAKRLEQLDGVPRHVDHIIPIKGKNVCGLHVANNLQVLTAAENLEKSNQYGCISPS